MSDVQDSWQCSVCESDWGSNRVGALGCCSSHKGERFVYAAIIPYVEPRQPSYLQRTVDALQSAYEARDAAIDRACSEARRQFDAIIHRRRQEYHDAFLAAVNGKEP